jgi:hypothetical protein
MLGRVKMNLEQRVIQEVDTWVISVKNMDDTPVSYEQLIKPICYGMAIAVTKTGIRLYGENRESGDVTKNYISLGFNEAVEEFKKDLIIYQYLKEGTVKRIAKVLSVGSKEETGTVILCQILKRNGLTFRDISANPEKYKYTKQISTFNITDDEVVTVLGKEIKIYSGIVRPSLFQKLFLKNSCDLATRLSAMAKSIVQEESQIDFTTDFRRYENMSYTEALEIFKANYLKQQFIESGYNGKLAAQRAGISYGSYKEHMCRRKINMTDLKQNKSNQEYNTKTKPTN